MTFCSYWWYSEVWKKRTWQENSQYCGLNTSRNFSRGSLPLPLIFCGIFIFLANAIILRGFFSDWTRFMAKKSGKTVYGMMESPICKFFVCSRIMRGFYGSMKMILFTLLSIQFVFSAGLENMIFYLTISVVIVNLIRGLPVIYDGKKYF